jgi:hypothetical protein
MNADALGGPVINCAFFKMNFVIWIWLHKSSLSESKLDNDSKYCNSNENYHFSYKTCNIK